MRFPSLLLLLLHMLAPCTHVAVGAGAAQHRCTVALSAIKARVTIAPIHQQPRWLCWSCLVSARNRWFCVSPLRPACMLRPTRAVNSGHRRKFHRGSRVRKTQMRKISTDIKLPRPVNGCCVQYRPVPAFPFASCSAARPPSASAAARLRSSRPSW